jgi:hypothetical protein
MRKRKIVAHTGSIMVWFYKGTKSPAPYVLLAYAHINLVYPPKPPRPFLRKLTGKMSVRYAKTKTH